MKVDWKKLAVKTPDHERITHFILITNFQESIQKLAFTLTNLMGQTYNHKKIYIVLGMEESEGANGKKRADWLMKKYANEFAGIFATYHPLLEGEEKGKASNEAYAARWISKKTRELGLNPKDVIVSSCDADSILDKQYVAYLTTSYLKDPENIYHFYWAPVLLYNNYWKLNFFIRMQTTVSSILRLAFLSEKYNLIQISTYSMSLWLLEEVGYWDTDIIPEDWHIFLQAFFKFGNKVKTMPIYLITTRDGVRGNNFMETMRNRYEQEKRWAWGVSDIPYVLNHLFTKDNIPFLDKLLKLIGLLETHYFWPTSFFIMTVGAFVPAIINPYFKRTVLGYLLPKITGGILTLSTSFIIVIAYLDHQSKHKLLKKSEMNKMPILVVQWILFPILSPIISAFLSSFPALESHTRLMFGKKLQYKVTKKF